MTTVAIARRKFSEAPTNLLSAWASRRLRISRSSSESLHAEDITDRQAPQVLQCPASYTECADAQSQSARAEILFTRVTTTVTSWPLSWETATRRAMNSFAECE